MYIGALAAPMFFVTTLFSSAAAGIEDVVDSIAIPDLSDTVNLGPFNFITDALDALSDILVGFIRGLLYLVLAILFDQFVSGIKAQFLGSITSIVFLVKSRCIMMRHANLYIPLSSSGIHCDALAIYKEGDKRR